MAAPQPDPPKRTAEETRRILARIDAEERDRIAASERKDAERNRSAEQQAFEPATERPPDFDTS